MASCSGRTKLTPRQFCFPGTHDTGAYQPPDFTVVASDEAMAKSPERFAPGFQEVASRWAVSQPGASIYEQLMNGVRYLDLRVAYAKDETGTMTYYLVHTFAISKLQTALDDIARFLDSHPTEMVMFTAFEYYHIVPQECQDFIETRLKKYLYLDKTGDGTITDTVDAIVKSGKQIIAVWGGSKSERINLGFFALADMIYQFPFLSVDNVKAKQAYILKNLTEYMATSRNKVMFQLTYTLTEIPIDVAASVFANGSLVKFADTMNPTQKEFVSNLTKDQRSVINVITNDDQKNSVNVDIAKMLIAERVGDALFNSSPPLSLPCAVPGACSSPRVLKMAGASQSAWHCEGPVQQRRRQKSRIVRMLCCCCCGDDSDDEGKGKLLDS